jgi:hypothetical protein
MRGVTVRVVSSDQTVLTSAASSAPGFELPVVTLPSSGTYSVIIDPGAASIGTMHVSASSFNER